MKKTNRGTAMVEFSFSVLIWALLFSGFIYLCRLVIFQQQAHAIARFGSFLLSTNRVSNVEVENQMADYASHFPVPFDLPRTMVIGRYLSTPASRFYRLVYAQVRMEPLIQDQVVIQQEGD